MATKKTSRYFVPDSNGVVATELRHAYGVCYEKGNRMAYAWLNGLTQSWGIKFFEKDTSPRPASYFHTVKEVDNVSVDTAKREAYAWCKQ